MPSTTTITTRAYVIPADNMCFGKKPAKTYYYHSEVVPTREAHHHHHHKHHAPRASYTSSHHRHSSHSPRVSTTSHHRAVPVVYERTSQTRYY
ncbi:hypothetical protein PG984_001886 [Apiospora sp. TS-2023a]